MIEKFSSQYYIGRLYIEPLPTNTEQEGVGRIHQTHYDALRDELYGVTVLEPELVLKIENTHILVSPSDAIPEGTVAIDTQTLESLSIDNTPTLEEVFFLTRDAVEQFNKFGIVN